MNDIEKEFVEDQTGEAVYDYILEHANVLFDKYPELENFSWTQGFDEVGAFIADVDDFTINDCSFWGTRGSWKHMVNNELRLTFELINPDTLLNLFGDGVKIVVHRDGVDVLSL